MAFPRKSLCKYEWTSVWAGVLDCLLKALTQLTRRSSILSFTSSYAENHIIKENDVDCQCTRERLKVKSNIQWTRTANVESLYSLIRASSAKNVKLKIDTRHGFSRWISTIFRLFSFGLVSSRHLDYVMDF